MGSLSQLCHGVKHAIASIRNNIPFRPSNAIIDNDMGTFLHSVERRFIMLLMSERTDRLRLTADVPDRIRRALNIRAARLGISVGEVVTGLVEDGMADDLSIADRSIAEGKVDAPKRGRKPRPSTD